MSPRPAGTSALARFRSERRRRRQWLAGGTALTGVAGAMFGWIESSGAAGTAGRLGRLTAGSAALVGAVVVAGCLASGRWHDLDRWRRGAMGERLTAERLDELPPRRWAVWHDLRVPGSRANIDHLVVGRTGIWVVDTKTTRSPVRRGWRSVRLGERRLDTDSTRWEAEVVVDRLTARLGGSLRRPLPVRPIVALHGHGLSRRGGRAGGVRVVPAEELLRSVRRGRRRLARSEVWLVRDAVVRAFPSEGGS
jgi:hypothetical protein